MPPIVKDLLLSKKFVVALLTTVGSVASYFGWNVDPTAMLLMMTPFLVYIGAQGWGTDSGKEKAKIEQETALKLQANHAVNMSAGGTLRTDASAGDVVSGTITKIEVTKGAQPGFSKLLLLVVLSGFTLGVGTAFVACSHPGRSALQFGQCVLDDGVLGEVLAALKQQNYLKQLEELGLRRASDLIDCALQAVASKSDDQGSGSGSGSDLPAVAARSSAQPDTLAARARDALEHRKSSGK